MAEISAAGAPLPFMGSGVKQDLHTMLSKFQAVESDRIRYFAEVFREMRFETILHYRINPAEYLEFTEYLLQNAARYFGKLNEVQSERSFLERIFGIYTCYAIYNLQPIDHVVQIPVTMLQYQELMEFQNELTVKKALEPIAALKNLLIKKAFKISVFQSTYDPATHKRYLAEEEMPEFKTETVEPFARAKQIETNRTMGEIMYLHKAYIAAKQKLGITDIKLVEQMNPRETIQQHIRTHQMAVEPEQVESLPKSAGNSRSELRSRAYKEGMKHTRNRRYLDPNMEENFKNIPTFGDIAQQCLQEPNSSHPTTSTATPTEKPKPKRRRAVVKQEDVVLTDEQIAEQVLQNEYASRVKPEVVELEETTMFGGKRQGTGGVAKIRAPPKKKEKIKLVEVKTERRNEEESTRSSEPPTKRKRERLPPRVSSHLASQFSSLSGSVAATDKKMKKLQTQIKIEPFDDH